MVLHQVDGMTIAHVSIKEIHKNPFRNFEEYPLIPSKIEALKASILERKEDILQQEELTANNIREMVFENFRTFRKGIKAREAAIFKEALRADPVMDFRRMVKDAADAMYRARQSLGALLAQLNSQKITGAAFGFDGEQFTRELKQLEKLIAEFKRIRTPDPLTIEQPTLTAL